MAEDPAKEKEELLKGLDDAEHEAKRIEADAKNVIQNARLISDAAPQLRILYQNMPVSALFSGEWSRQNLNVQGWLEVAKSMPPVPTDISTFGALSQGATNTAVSGVMLHYTLQLPPPSSPPPSVSSTPLYPVDIQKATERLAAIVEKHPSLENTRAEIQRLGLDSRGGHSKSALQLLEDAQLSLEIPVARDGSGAISLIGIRECINACLADLLRRRPRQEESGGHKEKVESIGGQCGRVSLNAAHFENLGIEAKSLNGQLSGAKQNALSRSDVQLLFHRALLFLAAFLGSIDESKLR